jgi:hypothetical protein
LIERGGYTTLPTSSYSSTCKIFIVVASDVSVVVWWCIILLKGKWLIPTMHFYGDRVNISQISACAHHALDHRSQNLSRMRAIVNRVGDSISNSRRNSLSTSQIFSNFSTTSKIILRRSNDTLSAAILTVMQFDKMARENITLHTVHYS